MSEHPFLPVGWLTGIFLSISSEISLERERQQAKFGEQNCPDAICEQPSAICTSLEAKELTNRHAEQGLLTWLDILVEEVAEAADEAYDVANATEATNFDPSWVGAEQRLRAELVQVAAVAVAWIEAIDRRST